MRFKRIPFNLILREIYLFFYIKLRPNRLKYRYSYYAHCITARQQVVGQRIVFHERFFEKQFYSFSVSTGVFSLIIKLFMVKLFIVFVLLLANLF